MEIKTKFNVRDKVFGIDFIYKNIDKPIWRVTEEGIICAICIKSTINSEPPTSIWYILNTNAEYLRPEFNCFSTQAEAQAECDKRNKGE